MDEPSNKTELTKVCRNRLTDDDAQMVCLLRQKHGYTLSELADRMDVGEQAIRRILSGDTHKAATLEYRRGPRAVSSLKNH